MLPTYFCTPWLPHLLTYICISSGVNFFHCAEINLSIYPIHSFLHTHLVLPLSSFPLEMEVAYRISFVSVSVCMCCQKACLVLQCFTRSIHFKLSCAGDLGEVECFYTNSSTCDWVTVNSCYIVLLSYVGRLSVIYLTHLALVFALSTQPDRQWFIMPDDCDVHGHRTARSDLGEDFWLSVSASRST